METKKNIINDPMKSYSSNKKIAKRHGDSIYKESISILGGRTLTEVRYADECSETLRKVRRIIEKKVCQEIHSRGERNDGNRLRYRERRQAAKQIKRICGVIPYAFSA